MPSAPEKSPHGSRSQARWVWAARGSALAAMALVGLLVSPGIRHPRTLGDLAVLVLLLPYVVLLWRLRRWRDGAGLGLGLGLGALGCVFGAVGLLNALEWNRLPEVLIFLGLVLAHGVLLGGALKTGAREKPAPAPAAWSAPEAPPKRLWTVNVWVVLSIIFVLWLLSRSVFELRNPCISAPVTWFSAQVLVLIPYVTIFVLFKRKRVKEALALSVAWGALAAILALEITLNVVFRAHFQFTASSRLLQWSPILLLVQAALTLDGAIKYCRLRREASRGRGLAIVFSCFVYSLLIFGIGSSHPLYPSDERNALASTPLGSLRTILTAELTYAATYEGYSASLKVLGPFPNGAQPSASAAGLLDEGLASGEKDGYVFAYVPGPRDAAGNIKTFTLTADPGSARRAQRCQGARSYFTDESGVIRVTGEDRPATAGDPAAP